MNLVCIDGARIRDEDTFHVVFSEAFGYPQFYGRNFNAWIDCMSYLDEPGAAGMSSVHVPVGQQLTIQVNNAGDMKARCPDVWLAFLEAVAFVNWRRTQNGESGLLAVAAYA